eukprot:NODE_144_length_17694_cov_0.489741.p13 type:complete len:123 gc:universal NODE_144_length_17694_cov_0.489741:1829-2197(+)
MEAYKSLIGLISATVTSWLSSSSASNKFSMSSVLSKSFCKSSMLSFGVIKSSDPLLINLSNLLGSCLVEMFGGAAIFIDGVSGIESLGPISSCNSDSSESKNPSILFNVCIKECSSFKVLLS